ncbi:MAG: aspartate kinase [Myxococcota bacterium]
MKFGGSSLADRPQIEKAAHIIADRSDRRPVVVCSAHRGVTDLLLQEARRAQTGQQAGQEVIRRQRTIASDVGLPESELETLYQELLDTLRGISLLREMTPRIRDLVQSFGERMSVRVVAHVLCSMGLDAKAFDAFDIGFVTDAHHGSARPTPEAYRLIPSRLEGELRKGTVPVITGFVGQTARGDITTVGRNGSDYSAAVLAAALGAEECQIWTDTDGVMTADPNLVPGARNIPHMSFAEASELARYGGRVLHPSTLVPAMERNVPVRVLNTNRPTHPGTVITEAEGHQTIGEITSIAYKEHQTVLTIESSTMLGQPGFLARVFGLLGDAQVDLDMISTSEVTVSMTTREALDDEVLLAKLRSFGRVEVMRQRALVCIVGRKIRSEPLISARVFQALAEAEVEVGMISHGAHSMNLGVMMADADVARAVPALHAAFFGA